MDNNTNNKKNKWIAAIPFICYFLVMLIIHMAYKCLNDDMALIRDTLKPSVWDEFSSVVYNFTTWSSRVLVNLPIHIMLHFDYKVWLFIEMLLIVLIMYGLSYIFANESKQINYWIIMSLLLMFPFDYAISAGWVTTTMTYIWPIAFGVLACTSIRKYIDGKKIKLYEYILYALITIYSANQEQMSVLLLVIFASAAIISIYRRKASLLIIMQSMCAFANLMFHMLAPGNSNRSEVEAAVRFADYNTLSLMDKLEIGFTSSLYEFVFRYNRVFLMIGILVIILVFQKYKNWFYRLIACVSLLSQLFFGIGCQKILEERYHIGIFANRLLKNGTIDESNYYRWVTYYPIVFLFGVSICLIVSVYLILGNSEKFVMALALLFGGLGGRMVVAFSPTVWASSNRTYTVMYFAFIALAILLSTEINYKSMKKGKYVIVAVAAILAMQLNINLIGMLY